MEEKTVKERIAALLSVKSLVTLALTGCMVAMVFTPEKISNEMVALFSSTYGATITYFFTKQEGK